MQLSHIRQKSYMQHSRFPRYVCRLTLQHRVQLGVLCCTIGDHDNTENVQMQGPPAGIVGGGLLCSFEPFRAGVWAFANRAVGSNSLGVMGCCMRS